MTPLRCGHLIWMPLWVGRCWRQYHHRARLHLTHSFLRPTPKRRLPRPSRSLSRSPSSPQLLSRQSTSTPTAILNSSRNILKFPYLYIGLKIVLVGQKLGQKQGIKTSYAHIGNLTKIRFHSGPLFNNLKC